MLNPIQRKNIIDVSGKVLLEGVVVVSSPFNRAKVKKSSASEPKVPEC